MGRILFAFWLMGGLCNSAYAVELTAASQRSVVADFSLKTLKGKALRLSKYRGKVVVVTFWATWCEPCLQGLSHLDRKALAQPDDVIVLAISTDNAQTVNRVRGTVRRKRWRMPILLDTDGQVAADINPRSAHPYTLFIDRSGRLAADHVGFALGDVPHMLSLIDALVATPKPASVGP